MKTYQDCINEVAVEYGIHSPSQLKYPGGFYQDVAKRYARYVTQDALKRAAEGARLYPRVSDSGPERINPYTITETEIITL